LPEFPPVDSHLVNEQPANLNVPGSPAADAAPVDLAPLFGFTDGNSAALKELVALYVRDTTRQLKQLEEAIAANDARSIHEISHSCAGSNDTCGAKFVAAPLRVLAHSARKGDIGQARELHRQAASEFQRVLQFLQKFGDAL
jgi:HPt (histidine-containing phosphotransfer) domain-containing protein